MSSNIEKTGLIKISDEVIGICASNGALKTPGVHSLAGSLTENLSRNILGRESAFKGIKIGRNQNNVFLDVFIIVNYKVKIPDVAWEVQRNVKNEVEHITDLSVKTVNIHVQGVDIPEREETYEQKLQA